MLQGIIKEALSEVLWEFLDSSSEGITTGYPQLVRADDCVLITRVKEDDHTLPTYCMQRM